MTFRLDMPFAEIPVIVTGAGFANGVNIDGTVWRPMISPDITSAIRPFGSTPSKRAVICNICTPEEQIDLLRRVH